MDPYAAMSLCLVAGSDATDAIASTLKVITSAQCPRTRRWPTVVPYNGYEELLLVFPCDIKFLQHACICRRSARRLRMVRIGLIVRKTIGIHW